MIRLCDVYKIYHNQSGETGALRDINLNIGDGEFVSIVGSSGSGKTTLMNIMGCLDVPTKGTYYLDGHPVVSIKGREMPKIRNEKIGFIFQGFNLVSNLTAYENVELPLMLKGVDRQERKKRADDALKHVGMANRRGFYPRELSGGQQQRIAIARALAGEPSLILADEPTGNLDIPTGNVVMDLICELNEQGKTVVLITHDPAVAAQANRIIQMNDGRIV